MFAVGVEKKGDVGVEQLCRLRPAVEAGKTHD
jgi:hypothetical protein